MSPAKSSPRKRRVKASNAKTTTKDEMKDSDIPGSPGRRGPAWKKRRQFMKEDGSSSNENSEVITERQIHDIYQLCVLEEDNYKRLDYIREWEERGSIAQVVWPFLIAHPDSPEFIHACHLLVVFSAYHFRDGCFQNAGNILERLQQHDTIDQVLETLFYKTDTSDYELQTSIVTFVIGGLSSSSSNKTLQESLLKHMSGIPIMYWIPERRREYEFKKSSGLRRKFTALEEEDEKSKPKHMIWIVSNAQKILHLLEGQSEFGTNLVKFVADKTPTTASVAAERDDDAEYPKESEYVNEIEKTTMDVPLAVWNYIHRSLELWIDLLSMTNSRLFLIKYCDAIHFNVRCRLAVGHYMAAPENLRLVQHLLRKIHVLLEFPITDDGLNEHLSKVDVISMHHTRATILQKMAYRHYPRDLQQVIYAGVGLLCDGRNGYKNSYLERSFVGFSDEDLLHLLYRMRLIHHKDDKNYTRNFLLEVLANALCIPPYPTDQLKALPLYPTETVLWDHNIIPPSSAQLRVTQVLALPKLTSQFLSFQDYLSRNFELVRLESAYGIRSDLVNVLKRVRPTLRQSSLDESEEIQVKTEFSGWSRMALELSQPLKILEVQSPKLGESVSQRITAEIEVDLGPYSDAIRREWNEIGDCDNLFLITVDASKMSGESLAPLLQEYHLKHGLHKMWDTDEGKRIPDDEDFTFPARFGITAVRGCMVYKVRNEHGTILSEPGVELNDNDRKSVKRIFSVALDTAQYAKDLKSAQGGDLYRVTFMTILCAFFSSLTRRPACCSQFSFNFQLIQTLNLVVRRHGRENNFKSVLETIRGLLEGAGSIDRVIPQWLRPIILGYGEPSAAHYQSDTMKAYAMNTVGVNKPTDYLDFGDTFLDEAHLRASFKDGSIVLVDGKDSLEEATEKHVSRTNYKIRFSEEASDDGTAKLCVDAMSVPFPKGVSGNPIRFTPVQVEAIRSGLSPGLSLVVGPPGTGKTDVAVQIIASLYHSFPTQRTIIITHSNAALNDIFSKVMARGDVDERYMVRLGSGERDLQVDSTHDFTKIGRVQYSISRRNELLQQVQLLSESIGVSDTSQRGADGSSSYTCESAEYFKKHHVNRKVKHYELAVGGSSEVARDDVSDVFPFRKYFQVDTVTVAQAKQLLDRLEQLFEELAEYRPFELLRSQRQRSDYLITKQARIVAMTCTHAAIARSNLLESGFQYDNVVMEEAGQMLEIETFIPLLLQRGKVDDSVAGLSRLKRICMLGDHNQLPPVVKNAAFSKFSNLDHSQFSRLVKRGVPYVQLDKQGRARPELRSLYRYVDFFCIVVFFDSSIY